MREEVINNLSLSILNRFDNNLSIRDEQIHKLFELAIELFQSSDLDHLPRSFVDLSYKLKSMYQYDQTASLSIDQAIQFGALWSVVQMIDISKDKKKEKPNLLELSKRHKWLVPVLTTISEHHGITHNELAGKVGKSKSELSQNIAKLQNERLFSFSKYGREKYYYLEARGQELLSEVQKTKTIEKAVALERSQVGDRVLSYQEDLTQILQMLVKQPYSTKSLKKISERDSLSFLDDFQLNLTDVIERKQLKQTKSENASEDTRVLQADQDVVLKKMTDELIYNKDESDLNENYQKDSMLRQYAYK